MLFILCGHKINLYTHKQQPWSFITFRVCTFDDPNYVK